MKAIFKRGVRPLSGFCLSKFHSWNKKRERADWAYSLLGAIHTFHMSPSLPALMILAERSPSPLHYLVKNPPWISQASAPVQPPSTWSDRVLCEQMYCCGPHRSSVSSLEDSSVWVSFFFLFKQSRQITLSAEGTLSIFHSCRLDVFRRAERLLLFPPHRPQWPASTETDPSKGYVYF